MSLFAFGINHTTAPLAVREQVVFNAENLIGHCASWWTTAR